MTMAILGVDALKAEAKEIAEKIAAVDPDQRGELFRQIGEALSKKHQHHTAKVMHAAATLYN